MITPQKPKGLCPDCKVMVVLSADGTIRHHDRKVLNPHPTPQGLPADHGFAYHLLAKCPGGRKAPVPPPWNPECWHPPKVLGPNHVGWLLGVIPLYRYPEPVPDPNAPELFWVPKGFPPGCMGPYVRKDDTPDFDPGHENLTAKELCPDGVTEKESDHEGSSLTADEKTAVPAPKYCDPED